MLENILIVAVAIVVLAIVFCWGYIAGAFYEYPEIDNNTEDLYCFQCEIEMPVKEKNGRFYCSNCGLYHGSEI